MTGLLIDEIAQYLAANGAGTYTDTGNGTIFIGNLPDGDDAESVALCVYDTTGLPSETDIPLNVPGFQILLRDVDITSGQTRTQAIRDLLDRQYNIQFITNGTYVYKCNLTAQGGHIGRDEKGRDLFSLNFLCKIR